MSECEYRAARNGEFEQIRALWKEGFGDSDGLIEEYHKLLYRPENAQVACCDGKIVATVLAAPAVLHKSDGTALPVGYAYALATTQAYRRRGIGIATYQSMIRRKMSEDMACVAGGAEDDHLMALYMRNSWKTVFYVRELVVDADELPPPAQAAWAGADSYNALREAALQGTNHYGFDVPFIQMQEYICRESGGGLLRFPGLETSCAAAEYEEDTLLISELLAPDEHILACAAGVLQHLPAAQVKIRLPVWSGAALGAEIVPFGILLPEGNVYPYIAEHSETYLGLDLC